MNFQLVSAAVALLGFSSSLVQSLEISVIDEALHGAPCVPCEGSSLTTTCTIKVAVDLFASRTGYYVIDGCDGHNPTLHLMVGKTYLFDQSDISNWYHLIGFAYGADGAHAPVDELEPGIKPPGSSSTCHETLTCPAPMYVMDGKYQGEYSSIPNVRDITASENFGLDVVEPLFSHPLGDWQSYGVFQTYLKFDIQDFYQDLFYFCHVHSGMSARIKLLDQQGVMLSPKDYPPLPYEYAIISDYDKKCGTFNLTDWQLPNDQCVERFVCGLESGDSIVASRDGVVSSAFKDCVDSANCFMMASMTTQGDSIPALFCRQMIPHHENAINMAKSLLKHSSLECYDVKVEEGNQASIACELIPLLRDIINNQNSQIMDMEVVLELLNKDLYGDCIVEDIAPMQVLVGRQGNEHGATETVYEHAIECTPCAGTAGVCSITVKVDLYSSEMGHFIVDGCDGINPTLLLQVGRTYMFDQSDISNWYHLIGFAYGADGAHVPVDELEPANRPHGTDSMCAETNSCPAPMYFMNRQYQGTYSNNPDLFHGEPGSDDFGLDTVEPLFFHPIADWQGYGVMQTYLKFDVEINRDIFYFCHIHSGMSGRIKLLDAQGNKLSEENIPKLPYDYDKINAYDASCGGYNLSQWQLPHPQCPSQFVCGLDEMPTQIMTEEGGGPQPMMSQATFAGCIESMNCFMLNGMTTNYGGEDLLNGGTDDIVLFLRQMIPHHQNAVNMAKALLKSNTVVCSDLAVQEGSSVAVGCLMEPIARQIVAAQNNQIQIMKGMLKQVGAKEFNDCRIGGCKEQKVIAKDPAVGAAWGAVEALMLANCKELESGCVIDSENDKITWTFDFSTISGSNVTQAYEATCAGIETVKASVKTVMEDVTLACTAVDNKTSIRHEVHLVDYFHCTGVACDDDDVSHGPALAFAVKSIERTKMEVSCVMGAHSGTSAVTAGFALAMAATGAFLSLL